jgi:hypothetical protein
MAGEGNRVHMDGDFEIIDRYDWKENLGKSVTFFQEYGPEWQVTIKDDLGEFVETHGGAVPFVPRGTFRGSITGEAGQPLPQPRFPPEHIYP